jgi:hypothetical protein
MNPDNWGMHADRFVFPNKARTVRAKSRHLQDHDAEGFIMAALIACVELNSLVNKLWFKPREQTAQLENNYNTMYVCSTY